MKRLARIISFGCMLLFLSIGSNVQAQVASKVKTDKIVATIDSAVGLTAQQKTQIQAIVDNMERPSGQMTRNDRLKMRRDFVAEVEGILNPTQLSKFASLKTKLTQ